MKHVDLILNSTLLVVSVYQPCLQTVRLVLETQSLCCLVHKGICALVSKIINKLYRVLCDCTGIVFVEQLFYPF